MINVNVVNDPPKITCSVVIAREDTPRPIRAGRLRDRPEPRPDHDRALRRDGRHGRAHAGIWYFVPSIRASPRAPSSCMPSDGDKSADRDGARDGRIDDRQGHTDRARRRQAPRDRRERHWPSLGRHAVDPAGNNVTRSAGTSAITRRRCSGPMVAHRFRKPGTLHRRGVGQQRRPGRSRSSCAAARSSSWAAPSITDGVMELTVRTRAAGKLFLRADSRSQTSGVPAGLDVADAAHPGHDGPARTADAPPHAEQEIAPLRVFSVRRLVLVSPRSAG